MLFALCLPTLPAVGRRRQALYYLDTVKLFYGCLSNDFSFVSRDDCQKGKPHPHSVNWDFISGMLRRGLK